MATNSILSFTLINLSLLFIQCEYLTILAELFLNTLFQTDSESVLLRRDDLGFVCDIYIESDGDWNKSLEWLQEKLLARDISLEEIQHDMINIRSLAREIVNYNRANAIILSPTRVR